MYDRSTKRAFALFLGGIVLTLGGCATGCGDMKLRFFGERTEATAGAPQVIESHGRSGRKRERWYVDFTFVTVDGRSARGSDTVSASWRLPEDRKVAVLYDPGEPEMAALAENIGLRSFWLMGLGIGLTALGGYRFMRQGG